MWDSFARAATAYRTWLGLATLLFSLWYLALLLPGQTVTLLATAAGIAHETLPGVPAVSAEAVRRGVRTLVSVGVPGSVLALFVAFGLFHRQADTS